MEKRGLLWTLEGTDCSGKGTQTKLLLKSLRRNGFSAEMFSFPTYKSPSGRVIGQAYLGKKRDEWLGDTAWFGDATKVDPKIASMLYAIDRFAVKPLIEEALQENDLVILDRYVESNMAHQTAKLQDPKERSKLVEWLKNLEYCFLDLPKPDKVFFLYMPRIVAERLREGRKEKADGHESNQDYMRRSEEVYLQLAESQGWHKILCAPDGTFDSLRTPKEIGEEILNKSMEFLTHNI